jgi:hypothetical protein
MAISRPWWKLRYQFRPNSPHYCPYLLSDVFKDGRFEHVAMDRLQFGRHQQPAANDARLIGKADLLSSFGNHRQSSSASRFTAGASGFLNFNQSGERVTHSLETEAHG